ncbi:hypothetical protein BS47DRAFT_1449412 [Hydnum rufescens UP504]|uniref:Uncharacterized protein n=1 Tax=Hydnum rufescens UP504 TaxID=1448309 RepID=A0A9P6AD00_9AGAM|nr:hypothetical protein BS47DRAFT_1449412 [Hydnum rufescens UP504]
MSPKSWGELDSTLFSPTKRTTSQCTPGKEPKSSIPEEDFKGILELAHQISCNIEAGNQIATQLATLLEDIHTCFDTLAADMSAIPSNTPPPLLPSYSQALSLGKTSAPTGHQKTAPPPMPTPKSCNPELDLTLIQSHPANLVYPTTLFPELKQLMDTAIIDTDGNPLKVHAVSYCVSKDIIITMSLVSDADCLCFNTSWVPLLSKELTLYHPIYAIIEHCIPTSFDPSSKDDLKDLQQSNPGILDSLA